MKTTTRRHLAVGASLLAMTGALSACSTGAETGPSDSQVESTVTPPATDETADDSTPATAGTHTDGTYSATGTYLSPAGEESIEVSVKLANDIITEASVTPHATDAQALQFQQRFASGISAAVVGKKIDDVTVGAVSGSSLTGAGFNQALETITAQSLK